MAPPDRRRVGPIGLPGLSLRSWHLFGVLAIATLAVSIGTNRVVLTDEVFGRFAGAVGGSEDQSARLLEDARQWELLSYALLPLILLARVTIAALLVQLALLLMGAQKALASILQGALWAQGATLLGSAAQALWIWLLPASSITAATLETPPGTLASLLPISVADGSALGLLIRQVGLFDLAWITLFATAIEDGSSVSARKAFASVGCTWLVVTAIRWGALLYLTGMA